MSRSAAGVSRPRRQVRATKARGVATAKVIEAQGLTKFPIWASKAVSAVWVRLPSK